MTPMTKGAEIVSLLEPSDGLARIIHVMASLSDEQFLVSGWPAPVCSSGDD
jgi:hypothetical protein